MLATTRPVESKIKQIAKENPANHPIRILFVKDFLKLTKHEIGSLTTQAETGATAHINQ